MIDRPDLADDERFKTNVVRGANRDVLVPVILAEIKSRSRAMLLARLAKAGIPCGEVLGLYEAMTSERAVTGGLVTKQPHPVAGSTHVLAPPYKLDGQRLPVRLAPPVLGEGTSEVLSGMLGLSAERLAELKASGVT